MPTYVVLTRWTEKGIQSVKDSPSRLDALKKEIQAAGGQVKAFYLVMGRYDMVLIAEARSDEDYARILLSIGAAGNVRTETLRAFTEDEYRKLIASMP